MIILKFSIDNIFHNTNKINRNIESFWTNFETYDAFLFKIRYPPPLKTKQPLQNNNNKINKNKKKPKDRDKKTPNKTKETNSKQPRHKKPTYM